MAQDICCQICNQYSDELTFEKFKHCTQNGWYCHECKPYDKCINSDCSLCHYKINLTSVIISFIENIFNYPYFFYLFF